MEPTTGTVLRDQAVKALLIGGKTLVPMAVLYLGFHRFLANLAVLVFVVLVVPAFAIGIDHVRRRVGGE